MKVSLGYLVRMLEKIAAGRTDLVFEYLAAGNSADPLMQHCAYYGDVSAIKMLLAAGESLQALGEDLGLIGACFHGHWRLSEFLIERGADINFSMGDTAETPLHSALCKAESRAHSLVVRVLLAHGANPNCTTRPGVETGGFMRDCRTRAETPLHRAAAFADEETIQALLDAGADREARDMNGDSPLTWGSWHLRPASILRKLCFGDFRIRPTFAGMEANLLGNPVKE